jgi:hypothetical protein
MDTLRSHGHSLVSRIQSGSLVGSAVARYRGVVLVVEVDVTAGEYGQDDFEHDLRKLAEQLPALRELSPDGQLTLVFRAGGDLRLPDWFWRLCENLGIRVLIVEAAEDDAPGINRQLSLGLDLESDDQSE